MVDGEMKRGMEHCSERGFTGQDNLNTPQYEPLNDLPMQNEQNYEQLTTSTYAVVIQQTLNQSNL